MNAIAVNLPNALDEPRWGWRPLVTDAEIGARIKAARLAAGFRSGAAFAESLGLSQSTVSRIEAGARRISATELAQIAELLGQSPHYFLRDQGGAVFYRRDSGAALTDEVAEALKWLEGFAERLRVLREYTDQLDLPKPYTLAVVPPQTFEDAQSTAHEVRQFLDMGIGPAPDMFAVLERVGCAVVVRSMDSADFEAMYVPQPAGIVLLSASRPGVRQRFTLAHELAHHLFHSEGVVVDDNLFGDWRLDQIANSFAAHFLMPRPGIELELLRRFGVRTPDSAEHAHWLAYHFGVSVDALCYQLRNTGLASTQATSKWRHANKKYMAATLELASDSQYPAVGNRWPPELIQRLAFLLQQGVLDREALKVHLENDAETIGQIMEKVAA